MRLLRKLRILLQPSFKSCKSCEHFRPGAVKLKHPDLASMVWVTYVSQPMQEVETPGEPVENEMGLAPGTIEPVGLPQTLRVYMDVKSAKRKGATIHGLAVEVGGCAYNKDTRHPSEVCGAWA